MLGNPTRKSRPDDGDERPVRPLSAHNLEIPVFGYYEGHRFNATMLRTSLANGFNGASRCIQYNGRLSSAKDAMIAVIRTINPAFNPGKKQYGLGFWHVSRPRRQHRAPFVYHVQARHSQRRTAVALRQRVLSGFLTVSSVPSAPLWQNQNPTAASPSHPPIPTGNSHSNAIRSRLPGCSNANRCACRNCRFIFTLCFLYPYTASPTTGQPMNAICTRI